MKGGAILALAGAGLAGVTLLRRSKKGSKATRPKKPTTAALSPFEAGSYCKRPADEATVSQWFTSVVADKLAARVGSFERPAEDESVLPAINKLVSDVLHEVSPECAGAITPAVDAIWRTLWCEAATVLAALGKIDSEPEGIIALCRDPSFDPRDPTTFDEGPDDRPLPPPPPWLPPPAPTPMPPAPLPPMDGVDAAPVVDEPPSPPPNLMSASSRDELTELGLMVMMEGAAASGVPVIAPSRSTVVFAYNPGWPGAEDAQAELVRVAADNPGIRFVEVSFADSQRHFGKPADFYSLAWALTAAGPDGRVFAEPIVSSAPHGLPSTAQWTTVATFAAGFLGAPGRRSQFGARVFRSLRRPAFVGSRTDPRSKNRPRRH